ncbi:M16 family metallopeptidase [Clostridium thermarum]|uniref:M16 family metallopeptidase n=1 Tax=Clostridium thermarum TaxID=1716543 RepID=UPI0013D5546B|nr:pitrilysin family protein [Clostridium thermarum]
MKEYILDNGIKLICEKRNSTLTSFCIGFNAGALEETGFNPGAAHAVEHMVFKATSSKTEKEINIAMDEVFGFNNAMTNYPYVIYYGTLMSEDFIRGFHIYSDILLNPTFPEDGFYEEMKVIREELRDWREDPTQTCEDMLLKNAYSQRRIKELIIGNEESIGRITLKELKEFYNRFYCSNNCVISVVTSLDLVFIYETVNESFGKWKREMSLQQDLVYEKNKPGIFFNEGNVQGAKLQFCYGIEDLTWKEIMALHYFNIIFGEGTSSILYDVVRTEKALAYEVGSAIKNERGIKLFSINISTSRENINAAIKSVEDCIIRARNYNWEEEGCIYKIQKRLALKNSLALERSIEWCKKVTTCQLMYGDYRYAFSHETNYNISSKDIRTVIDRVLKNPSIQILSS